MALSNVLPHIEGPSLGLSETLKNSRLRKAFSSQDSDEQDGSSSTKKRHLLPRLSWAGDDDIPQRRMQAIRNKIMSSYEKLMNSADSEELIALNTRMSHDISRQIETRLKELAEQVEIPL